MCFFSFNTHNCLKGKKIFLRMMKNKQKFIEYNI